LLLREGSSKAHFPDEEISLSASPLLLKSGWVIPVDLFSLLLKRRYGDKVWWDREGRRVRVGQNAYSVVGLRHCSYADHTRVVAELSKELSYSWNEEANRVVLLFKKGLLPPTLHDRPIADGLVECIRVRQDWDSCAIEISTSIVHPVVKVFALKGPTRVVVDVYGAEDKKKGAEAGTSAGIPAERKGGVSVGALTSTNLKLVIDPGHGGEDSGAVGPTGLKEKEVVLDIGLRLKEQVEKKLGVEVVMTRSDDRFVPLRERAAIANAAKGDLFCSIHANASLHGKAEGFETFFLSYEASDNEAREAAIRENNVIELEGVGQQHADTLKTVLWDMVQSEYIKESSRLAESVQNELDKVQKVANRGIKTAPFYVLMGAAMPAVLVEVAFISNPEGEKRLRDEDYRQSVCEALLRAVSEFKEHLEKMMGMGKKTEAS
jgi:N-acetylmuramoyl-L-alanine amidase